MIGADIIAVFCMRLIASEWSFFEWNGFFNIIIVHRVKSEVVSNL